MKNLAKSTVFLPILCFCCGYALSQEIYGPENKKPDFQWPEGKKMALSLTFDDARISQVEKGIPLLDKYNVKATFYISPNLMEQRIPEWEKALRNGHDIGNHSVVHPCSKNFVWARDKAIEDYTLESMYHELDSANRIIKKILGILPHSYAYPCGQTYVGSAKQAKSLVPLIASMFETGRTWMNEEANDPLYCDMAQLTGVEMDGKTFEQVLVLIEKAKAKGGWLVLAGHETGDGGRQTILLNTLEAVCKYAKDPANGIWIDNVQAIAGYVKKQRGQFPFEAMMPYQNPVLPVNERVEDLLSRMTIGEKIGQLNMPCGYFSELGKTPSEKMKRCIDFTEGKFLPGIGPGGGFFTLHNSALHEGPAQQAEYMNLLQETAMRKTRLKIPLLITEEGTHGLMCSGATIFPEGAALGSTWNTGLIREVYQAAAREARTVGVHQLFTLVVEPNRDPRLGRNQEGYSEDPFLCSRIAETIVEAVQGSDLSLNDKVVAGLCHYPGQSQPTSGLERGAMEISERTLREIFLPPWESGIKKAGALGVMATYPTIDGIPAHSSSKLLTEILRGELGFEGLVLSEGNGVNTLVYTGLAGNLKDAAAMAANAGMDVSISFNQGYFHEMIENIKEGNVSEGTIDRSVRRVLQQKFRLGLFDNPYVDPEKAIQIVHNQKHREIALNAALEGIVLLKNDPAGTGKEKILPLSEKIKSIALIGPNADDDKNQLGDYTARVVIQKITTILDGIRNKAGKDTRVTYVKGCNVTGNELNEIGKAVETARKSDVAIVVVGENEWQKEGKQGTVGEGYDAATLELTGLQNELVRKVFETGTPTVVVLINGRPLATEWIAENIPAIIEAWNPGENGGAAVAEVLFGTVNPSGKLPVSIPRHAGQLPVYYNHKPSKSYWLEKGWGNSYADMKKSNPLFEFGFGLSYTTFEYGNLIISPGSTGTNGKISVTCSVKNNGNRKGSEVVQLYLRDKLSSVVRPVKELKGFSKLELQPGETRQVAFALTSEELKMLDRSMNWMVEPGEFEVMVGSSSRDIRLTGTFVVN